MALTTDRIKNSSDHIDAVTKALIITLIRQHDFYRINAQIFSDTLSARIDSAEGSVSARMLNALMAEIDELDLGQVEIRGDKDALWWSQNKERLALVKEMLDVLFDEAAEGTSIILENGTIISGSGSTGVVPSSGNYGTAAIGQRPYYCAICGQTSPNLKCGCGQTPFYFR
jgi:hypothetical protein